ncbi:unnamed protein product [Orchesella dallaii]|uniref:F-box domain-containing protein n=1 Tax=Orchesella dallaii TaxID=48710 RepID=A0ABP1R1L9_9HEXA
MAMALTSIPTKNTPLPSTSNFNFSRIPPEAWKEVLNRVDDPQTFHNCYNTCEVFRDLLNIDRTSRLFPLVLPHIHDYLSEKDIINSRRVCKRWKTGIENHLPLNIPWKNVNPDDFIINPVKERWVFPLTNTFYKVSQITQFLTEMENCSGNPFPTRSLLFYHLLHPEPNANGAQLEVQDRDELFHAFRSLLHKFGNEVWSFVFITDTDNPELLPLHAWVQQMLKLLPNLKKLRLDNVGDELHGLKIWDEGWDWFQHLKPLPLHLISLHIGQFYSSRVAGSILNAVGGQLEYLGIEGTVIEEEKYFGTPTHPWFIREMPNLNELKITNLNFSRGMSNEISLLKRLARCRLPNLEKLSYAPKRHAREGQIPFRAVLLLMNQFATTLVELHVPFQLRRMVQNEDFEEEDDPEVMALLGVPSTKLKILDISYSMVDHPILESVLNKCVVLEKVRLQKFQMVRSRDLRGVNRNFVLRNEVRQTIEKLNGLVKSTKFKSIELWNKSPERKLYTWRRPLI